MGLSGVAEMSSQSEARSKLLKRVCSIEKPLFFSISLTLRSDSSRLEKSGSSYAQTCLRAALILREFSMSSTMMRLRQSRRTCTGFATFCRNATALSDVHTCRVGRTARAGAEGTAFTFASSETVSCIVLPPRIVHLYHAFSIAGESGQKTSAPDRLIVNRELRSQ